jgi:hypothetical protein
MPIYRIRDRNVLFIHVPKTGGTSIEAFLEGLGPSALHNQGHKLLRPYREALFAPSLAMQHFHADLLEAMFPSGFFDYAFMVVRNPVDRFASEYRHSVALNRLDSRLPVNLWSHLVLTVAGLAPSLSNNHYRPQAEFQCFGAEVFRFESGIPAILDQLAERLGVPPPHLTPHEKRSPDVDVRLSPQIVARLARVYARDFQIFGYPAP